MARSRKSIPVSKLHNDRYYKRLQHTRNRMLAREGIYLSSRQYKHTVNQWDICDYRWRFWHPIKTQERWATPLAQWDIERMMRK